MLKFAFGIGIPNVENRSPRAVVFSRKDADELSKLLFVGTKEELEAKTAEGT